MVTLQKKEKTDQALSYLFLRCLPPEISEIEFMVVSGLENYIKKNSTALLLFWIIATKTICKARQHKMYLF